MTPLFTPRTLRFSHPTVFSHARDSQASARLLIGRIGAVLFLVGGLTMVITLLAPSAGRPSPVAFVPPGLACFGFAAYLGFARRTPDWVLLATPPLATVLITAIMSIEGTISGTPSSTSGRCSLPRTSSSAATSSLTSPSSAPPSPWRSPSGSRSTTAA